MEELALSTNLRIGHCSLLYSAPIIYHKRNLYHTMSVYAIRKHLAQIENSTIQQKAKERKLLKSPYDALDQKNRSQKII